MIRSATSIFPFSADMQAGGVATDGSPNGYAYMVTRKIQSETKLTASIMK